MPNWSSRNLAILIAATALAQAPDKPASVQGVVLDTLTGAPIPRAHVTIDSHHPDGTLTTSDGRFSVYGIRPGVHLPYAERLGYVLPTGADAQIRITLQPGDKKTDLVLKLTPTGAILGRVLNSDGEPEEDIRVSAKSARSIENAATDDKGQFRIGGLAPGLYRVRATSKTAGYPYGPEIRTDGTEEVFDVSASFPGRVVVGPGVDTAGIDIRLVRAPIVRVSGRVTGLAPATPRAVITARSPDAVKTAAIGKDGSFVFWRLDPGRYLIGMDAAGMGSDGIGSADVEVEVAGSNVEGVEVRLAKSADLPGKLEFDDDEARQNKAKRLVTFDRILSDGGGTAVIEADDTFRLRNVPPGRYRVIVEPEDVYVKSLRLDLTIIDGSLLDLSNGADGNDLSITLSSATATLSGTADPAPARVVLAFEDGTRRHRYAIVKADGAWSIANLPPGSYKITATPPDDPDDHDDEMQPLELRPGDKIVKNLQWP
jgi:hypothetical protein